MGEKDGNESSSDDVLEMRHVLKRRALRKDFIRIEILPFKKKEVINVRKESWAGLYPWGLISESFHE